VRFIVSASPQGAGRVVVPVCLFSLLLFSTQFILPAQGLDRTWIGGNVDWVDGGSTANWNPADEPDADDTAIFSTPNTVNLGSNNTVNGLTLSGGIELFANGQDLTVDGLIQASGGGTVFHIDDGASLVLADTVAINSSGTIRLADGTLTVDEETGTGLLDINAGGTLTGFGDINLNDAPGAVTSMLINDGTLSAFRQATIVINPPPAGTLTINATAANARVNLDGGAEGGIVNVFRNQTLEINGVLQDAFTGDLNMFHETTLDISTAWSMDGGTFDVSTGLVDNPFPNPDISAGTATVAGGAFTQTGGTITNFSSDGTLIFDTAFTQTGGNFVNNGLVTFNGSTLISNTANMTMPTNTSSITVGSGAVVNVDQANFNVDGNGTATNVIRINSGGQLDLDLGAGADDTITGTVILSGGELDVTTADNTWSLGGTVSTVASSGTSQLNGETLIFDGATVTVASGSTLDINAASTWNTGTDFDIDGVVTVDGAATINAIGANAIEGTGTLRFGSTTNFTAINTTIETATFDWDGSTAGQVHTFTEDAQLFIEVTNFDSDGDMDDSITMAAGVDLTVDGVAQWEMRGTLTTNGTLAKPDVIGGTARMVLTSATGIWNVNGATFPGDVTFGPSSTTNIAGGALIAGSASHDMIFDGGTIAGAGTFHPHVQNAVTASSTISVANFDFDGGNWVIDSSAILTINVADYDAAAATNKFDATITLDGGDINMTTPDAAFVMDGTLNVNTASQSVWTGESIEIGNDDSATRAQLNVTGNGHITAPTRFSSDADVNVAAGATLSITEAVNFSTVNGANSASFTGGGTIRFNRNVNFTEATTFNMAGGKLAFDGSDVTANIINVDAPVVINAAEVEDFGNPNFVNPADELDISNGPNLGSMTVNLTNDNSPATLLAGSDVNLNGTVNVAGDVRVTARVDIGGTININTAGEPLRLGGGDGVIDPNRLEGGTISGVGNLGADAGESLHGFGTINTNIAFDGTADLRASGGTLTINGPILSVGTIGTANNTGVLNVVNAWETDGGPGGSIGGVNLVGGILQGGQITNDNPLGILGRGTISSLVVNNTKLVASFGGTLVVQTASNNNDWDGATNTGQLNAATGNLEIRDNLAFNFQGSANVSSNRELFVNGFPLNWEPGSSLNLGSGSRLRATASSNFGGTMTVAAGDMAEIFTSVFVFEATSDVTISGTLLMNTAATQIDAGATFGGTGTLRVPESSSNLRVQDGADVDVLIQNGGLLLIGQDAAAQATGLDYQQDPGAFWQVDLDGLGLNDFDRFNLDGAAQLAGTLDLELGGSYVPNEGDTFTILSAPGGVTGAFTTVIQPFGMPTGLLFDVVYSPTLVQLAVVEAPIFSADFDLDGDVDGNDLDEWQAGYGIGTLQTQGDADGDGDVDGRDFMLWQRQHGSVPIVAVTTTVPEPSCSILLMLALSAATACRFHK
jgi:fibronectin-binding autotransporter adhesin